MGALDFAGGTVVHINAAFAARAVILVIGRRKGWGKEAMHPHNLPMTILGAAMLWFGWFGFNAGSAVTSGGLAAIAFAVTHIATATGALGWILVEKLKTGKPTTLGAASGAVAGLVAITPASGYVGPIAAMVIGLVAGILCYLAVSLKFKFNYDDSLDVIGVHGVGGIIGALLTGVFASKVINSAAADGLVHGNPQQVVTQLIAVAATIAFTFIATFIIVKVIDAVMGFRMSEEDEVTGMDLALHNETGYALGGFSGGSFEHGSGVFGPEPASAMRPATNID
jgi:Amt family ammonium transporter